MWILMMNDMRWANFENTGPVCKAATREEIAALLERETVPVYNDPKKGYAGFPGTWSKTFRKGGPLEWFNSLGSRIVEIDIDKQVAGYRASIEMQVRVVPEISALRGVQ